MNLFDRLFTHKKKSNQTTFCYCPICNNELISSGSFVEDTDLVKYKCVKCQTETDWLFDAPAPLLLYVNDEPFVHKTR